MEKIIQYVEKYGFKGAIIGLILSLLWIVIQYWFSKYITTMVDKFFDIFKFKRNKFYLKAINKSDITNHEIFRYIDLWIYSRIPTFQFSTEYRTIVFRKYLVIFLSKYKDDIKRYVESGAFETMEDSQLWNSLLSLINDIIHDYEEEMISQGLPRIVIEKMKIKNNDTISLTIDLIEGVCNSQFYSSERNLLKIYSILNIMLSVLENIISNSESVCNNSINGQLKGMVIRDENGREFREP